MKKQTLFTGVLILALLFLNLHTYVTKNKIVDENYAIIFEFEKSLSKEINQAMLTEDWIHNNDAKERIMRLSNTVYEAAYKGSGYTIKDKAYSDKFSALNVFQDYAAQIHFILDKNQLSSEDLKYLNDFADLYPVTRKQN